MLPIALDLPLASGKAYVEANYLIADGGINEALRTQKMAELAISEQGLEVDRYRLHERVIHLFAGILLQGEQLELLAITQSDLEARRSVLEAGLANGVVLESEVAQLRVRELELSGQQANLRYRIEGMLNTLRSLTGAELTQETELILPALGDEAMVPALERAELGLFQAQRQAIGSQESLIAAQRRPKVGVFAQAGLGYPNPLNLFDNGIAPYGIGGVNFQWAITDWKRQQHQREVMNLRMQQLNNQEATFRFNIDAQTGEYLAEVERLESLLETDDEVVALQAEILSQLSAQLEHGVITANDYLIRANAELAARQQKALHEVQLIQNRLLFLHQRGHL